LRRKAAAREARRERERLRTYQDDPTRYALEVLGIRWWQKQIQIAQSIQVNRRTVVYAGHAVGKTHCIAGVVQWHFDSYAPSITLTAAPNWSSIFDLLWGEIRAQRPQNLPGRLLQLRLDGGPMHYAKGHNAENSSGFQGRHEARQLIVLDEAMGIPPYIWEATNAMMTSPFCRVVALGNPTETSGEYYDILENPDWNPITISCLEHPNIAAELAGQSAPYPKAVSLVWVQEMLKDHAMVTTEIDADSFEFPPGSGVWYKPDDVFRSRVLGLFPRQSSSAVWGQAWITAAREAKLEWREQDVPAIGADIARFGDDSTVLYAGRGSVVTHREGYAKQDTMETVGRIATLADKVGKKHNWNPKKVEIKVDDASMGGGVVDRLNELEYTVFGINAGETAMDPEAYFNRRAELWFVTAHRGRDNRLDLSHLPDDVYRKLSAELRAVRYKMQSDKTLRVESKDDLKKRTKRSPDDADALNLLFAVGQERKLKTGANPFF